MTFALYRDERRIFGFEDYDALLTECRRVGARRALEFGPGISTLALIESGTEEVATCEHHESWHAAAVELLKAHSVVAKVYRYHNAPAVTVDGLPEGQFDLAFVDSPVGFPSRKAVELRGQERCNRLNTVMFALSRAPVVLLHDALRPWEQNTLERVADDGHRVSLIPTEKGIARIERAAG